MRAATAHRIARSSKEKLSRRNLHQLEFDIIIKHITFEAGTGAGGAYFDVDLIAEDETRIKLQKLGYHVEWTQKSATSRPRWHVSWAKKVA